MRSLLSLKARDRPYRPCPYCPYRLESKPSLAALALALHLNSNKGLAQITRPRMGIISAAAIHIQLRP